MDIIYFVTEETCRGFNLPECSCNREHVHMFVVNKSFMMFREKLNFLHKLDVKANIKYRRKEKVLPFYL